MRWCYHGGVLAIALAACCLSAPPPAPASTSSTSSTSAWWRDDVFYEIYPRSFADSDGDGVGDLRGVTQHLDDLKALGVDDLWLTPIHPSPSEHGYDVTDYEDVAKDLGGLPALDALVREAHARKMRVVLDFVLNHSSVRHPWFAQHPDYYVWRDKPDDRFKRPWDGASVWHAPDPSVSSSSSTSTSPERRVYLGVFWSGMPDLNLANEAVVQAMEHAMVFWRKRGIDGFRIDAARHLIEGADGTMTDTKATHALLARLRADVAKQAGPGAVFIGEVWADDAVIASYESDLDLAFGFNVGNGIVDALVDDSRSPLVEELQSLEARFPASPAPPSPAIDAAFLAPFLRNHDMTRLARVLGGGGAVDAKASARLDGKLRLAAATLAALPGTPFLYYGEEVGMAGAPPRHAHDDASQRTKLDWKEVAAARADAGSLWHAYADVLAFRHAQPALRRGTATRLAVDGGGRGAFALLREGGGARVVFVANFADAPARFNVDVDSGASAQAADSVAGVASRGAHAVVADGKIRADLPAFGYAFVPLPR